MLPVSEGGLRIGGARIVRADVPCTNGVIHLVDAEFHNADADWSTDSAGIPVLQTSSLFEGLLRDVRPLMASRFLLANPRQQTGTILTGCCPSRQINLVPHTAVFTIHEIPVPSRLNAGRLLTDVAGCWDSRRNTVNSSAVGRTNGRDIHIEILRR